MSTDGLEDSGNLNTMLKLSEEKEYWEDKLLELKLRSYKTSSSNSKSSKKLNEELNEHLQRAKSLEQEIKTLYKKITEVKLAKNSNSYKLNLIEQNIQKEKEQTNHLTSQIQSFQEYYMNINKTENIVQHILTFPDNFKEQIYKEFTRRVDEVLKFNSQQTYQQMTNQGDKNNNIRYGPQQGNMMFGMRPPMMFYPNFMPPRYNSQNENNSKV